MYQFSRSVYFCFQQHEKRIGNKRKTIYCGLKKINREREISNLKYAVAHLKKERFTARRTADNYYNKWREERNEKENMMTQFDAQKEFQLPPSFYLESKSLETDCDNVSEIGSGAFW